MSDYIPIGEKVYKVNRYAARLKGGTKYRCRDCDVICTSIKTLEQHEIAQQHGACRPGKSEHGS